MGASPPLEQREPLRPDDQHQRRNAQPPSSGASETASPTAGGSSSNVPEKPVTVWLGAAPPKLTCSIPVSAPGATLTMVPSKRWTIRLGAFDQFRILTALAATRASVSSDMPDSAIINSLARSDNGIVSVGEKAVALVKDR